MKETGLFELLQKRIINNLVDYVTGVEVGLDSNGRKNRGGHLMENLVETFIVKAGFKKDKSYFKEMYSSDIEKTLLLTFLVDISASLLSLSFGQGNSRRFPTITTTS